MGEVVQKKIDQLANTKSIAYWSDTLARVETVMFNVSEPTYILSPLEIDGLIKSDFDRIFINNIGLIVFTTNPSDFTAALTEYYQSIGLALITPVELPTRAGFKFYCSGLLQCSVYYVRENATIFEEKTSPRINKTIKYIPPRFLLPRVYMWFDRLHGHESEHTVRYLIKIEALLNRKTPSSEVPTFGNRSEIVRILAGLDVAITGISSARVYLEKKPIDKTLGYPIDLLGVDIDTIVPLIKDRLAKHRKEEIEVFTGRVNHPSVERYMTAYRFKGVTSKKMFCSLIDLPRFRSINVIQTATLKYAAPMTTIMSLHLSAWSLERTGHAFANVLYGIAKKLRTKRVRIQKTELFGVYYSADRVAAYKNTSPIPR